MTITKATFYTITRYARTHGTTEYVTDGKWLDSNHYTPTFWVSVIRNPYWTHYIAIYRPTGDIIYDVVVRK